MTRGCWGCGSYGPNPSCDMCKPRAGVFVVRPADNEIEEVRLVSKTDAFAVVERTNGDRYRIPALAVYESREAVLAASGRWVTAHGELQSK